MTDRELFLELANERNVRDLIIFLGSAFNRLISIGKQSGFKAHVIETKHIQEADADKMLNEKLEWLIKSKKPVFTFACHKMHSFSDIFPQSPVAVAKFLINNTRILRDENGNFKKPIKIHLYQCKVPFSTLEIIDQMLQKEGIGNYRIVATPFKLVGGHFAYANDVQLGSATLKNSKGEYMYSNQIERSENKRNLEGKIEPGEKKSTTRLIQLFRLLQSRKKT